ncbi:MAG: hypothetical protein ACLFVJ_07650 [Persicimonas sp.]
MIMKRHNTTSQLLFALLAAVAFAALPACGDDASSGSGTVSNNDTDPNDGANNDPALDLDLAAAVEVRLDPARSFYRVGSTVTPRAIVIDGHGERITGASVQWQVSPDGATEAAGNEYTLREEGTVVFEACTAEDGVLGESVCGSKSVAVDASTPAIEVTRPSPGAWLGDDGSEEIVVEGKVTDTSETLHAFVNGQRVELHDSGAFSTTITPQFGINHIAVTATDSINRAPAQALLDVLWAPDWSSMSNTADETGFGFDDGIVIDLTQRFFDDGQLPDQPDESSLRTDDLTDIFSLLIKNIDFMNQIPDPALDTEAGQLRIIDLTIGEPDVLLELTDEGAELFIWVPNVEIHTQGSISFDNQSLDLTGTVDAEIAGFANLVIDKPSDDEDFSAEVADISLSLQRADSHFASPEANAVFDLAESALRSKIEELLVDTLQGQFIDALPAMLADALNSIEAQLDGLSFELATGFSDPLELSLDGSIASFDTTYRNSMTAMLSTDISANAPPALTDSPGIPLASEFTSRLPLFETSRAQIGLRLALLNGLLHSLWETGFLEIDLTDVMPEDYADLTENAQMSTKLQPVLSRPRAGEPYDFILRAGQMEIEAEMLGQTDVYVINLEVGILMSLDDNSIAISVPDEPTVTAWVESTTGDRAVLNQAALEELILGEVWPQLETTLSEGLAFDLPIPAMDGVSDLAPSLSELEVEFLLERPVTYRNGFIIFDAMLRGDLPLN